MTCIRAPLAGDPDEIVVEQHDPPDVCIAKMTLSLARTEKFAALFPNSEIPRWAWEADTKAALHDQMLLHGFIHDLVTDTYHLSNQKEVN